MSKYIPPIKCGDHTHKTWAAGAACRIVQQVWPQSPSPHMSRTTDNRNFPESMEEKLERLGACGMGYPSLGMPCVRPKGHDSPVSTCFALVKHTGATDDVIGVFMTQDSKDWTTDRAQWPTDLVVLRPLFEEKVEEIVPDRRGLVEHSRGKS
jgi:hypothetical protein